MATTRERPRSGRVELMGVGLDRLSEADTIEAALSGVGGGEGGWICPTNLEVLRQVAHRPPLREIVDQADVVVADGMPLLWASRLQGDPLPERVAGSSLLESLPDRAAQAGASIFLLGGDPGVAEEAAARLRREHPGIRIAGTHCPPRGFEERPRDMAALEAALKRAAPDVVFVALGFPKQERLILRLRELLPSAWFVACGIGLSFLSGDQPRAPRWAQRAGLEWLHRLAHEPRRLARRYLLDGIPFAVRVLATSARRRFGPAQGLG